MKINIAELKEKHGDLHQIESEDGKYKGIFRQPTKREFFLYHDLIKKQDSFTAITYLAQETFVAGNKEIYEKENYFLGIVENVVDGLQVVHGSIDGLTYTTDDGVKVTFKKPNRGHYGMYEHGCKTGTQYSALENVLKEIIIKGKEVLDEPKYYPGLNLVFSSLINVVASSLKKL